MEFDYVAGRYIERTHKFQVLGGFASLKNAQNFAAMSDVNFLSSGFMFVNAPEGIYIYGHLNNWDNHSKWFSPEEVKQDKVFLYSSEYDRQIQIDGYMPYNEYIKIQRGNVFSQSVQEADRDSVLGKLDDNRKITAERGEANTQRFSEKMIEHGERGIVK